MTPRLAFTTGQKVSAHRSKLGMNQSQFWSAFGVTKAGASRHESGLNIPKTVQLLLTIARGTEKQSGAVVDAFWRSKG